MDTPWINFLEMDVDSLRSMADQLNTMANNSSSATDNDISTSSSDSTSSDDECSFVADTNDKKMLPKMTIKLSDLSVPGSSSITPSTSTPTNERKYQNIKTYNWKKQHVQALIESYRLHQSKFSNINYRKNEVWKLITFEVCNILDRNGEVISNTHTKTGR